MPKTYDTIVVGIDQSYDRSGISVCADGKVIQYYSINYEGCKNNSDKRKLLSNKVHRLLTKCLARAKSVKVLVERVRTFSGGFISTSYILATGALIASIVDAAYDVGVDVYSVDTRSWKAQIVGTSKPVYVFNEKTGKQRADKKLPTIRFVAKRLGMRDAIQLDPHTTLQTSNGWNDDLADAICISLYGFIPQNKQGLKQEH